MVTISNSDFAAIKWGEYGLAGSYPVRECGINIGTNCLPVALVSDLGFQFIITFSSNTELLSFAGLDLVTLPVEEIVDFDTDVIDEETFSSGSLEVHIISETQILFQWVGDMDILSLINNGDCFRLGLRLTYTDDIEGSTIAYFDSKICFRKISATGDDYCYTSVIKYRNNENGFGFQYCYTDTVDYYFNKFRAPFYLSRPQYPETRRVFTKANGATQLVSSQVRKTYALRTDYMIEEFHEFLKIALAHDIVQIENKSILENFVTDDDYNIDWNEDIDMTSARASVRIAVTPYAAINSNCDECDLPACAIYKEGGNSITLNNDGDPVFYSEGTIEIDLSVGVTSENCPDGLTYQVYNPHELIDTINVDPDTGIVTIVMGVIDPGTYLTDEQIFEWNIVCNNRECPEPGQVFGTISDTECLIPQGLRVDYNYGGVDLEAIFSWTPPVPFPDPFCGFEVEVISLPGLGVIFTDTVTEEPWEIIINDRDHGFTPGDEYMYKVKTLCCDASESEFAELTEIAPETAGFPYALRACYGPNPADACCVFGGWVYIASPATALAVGVEVFTDSGLTTPVPSGYYIAESGGNIFITGAGGEIVTDTLNIC